MKIAIAADHAGYEEKEKIVPRDILTRVERDIMLQIVDQQWKDHLYSLDHLKEGIGLRGYGQRDPLIEYKKESYEIFQEMMELIQDRVVKYLWKTEVVVEREGERQRAARHAAAETKGAADGLLRRRRFVRSRADPAQRAQDRPQRSLLVRQREKVQEMPRQRSVGGKIARREFPSSWQASLRVRGLFVAVAQAAAIVEVA